MELESVGSKVTTQTDAAAESGEAVPIYDILRHAEILFAAGDFQAAVGLLHHVFLNHGQKIGRALELMAKSLHAMGRSEAALPFAKAWHRQVRIFDSAFLLGRIFYAMDRDATAAEFLKVSLTLTGRGDDKEVAEVYRLLGNLALRSGDSDSAAEQYDRVESICGVNDVLLVNRGTLAVHRAQWTDAADAFRRALGLNDRSDQAWTGLAIAHQQMGDTDLAIGNLEQALDINATNRTALLLLIEWALRSGRLELAAARMAEYLDCRPDDAEIANQRAKFLIQLGRLSEARVELDRALILDPEFQEAERLRDAIAREQARNVES